MALRSGLVVVAFLLLTVPAAAQTFVFHMSGLQETPQVFTTASGGCYGVLNQGAATFALTCVHSVESATVMHIHRGAAGDTGDIAFDMGDPASSPVSATWTSMTPADIADLLAGNLYVNIHTAGRPAGEIRGQILPRTVDQLPFTADGGQVVPPNGSASTANCNADLNDDANALAVECVHNVAGAIAAHIHDGPAGTNGPEIFTFPSVSPISANVPLTPVQVASFAATFLYLDIHTPPGTEEEPSDEIRGQIGIPPEGAADGTVIISKETAPAGGTGFNFSESIHAGTFTLDDGGTETFTGVIPGTYTITENDPSGSGYTLGAIDCDDDDSTGDTNSRTATIRVAAGETVRCTFRNLETAATDTLFVFHLSGDQEEPEVQTTETGGCMGRFDAGASELTLICTHNVDLPTVMHIHRAPAGDNGPIVFDMGDPTSPVIATWSEMTPAEVADLMAGNFYVNIHTSGRPNGAIRGQILTRTVDTIAFTADGSQVVPPGTTASTANCTADLNAAATALDIACTHTLSPAAEAHVHQAPRGENGPIAFMFPSPVSPFAASMPLTPRLVADFAASFLYLDIHGVDLGEEGSSDAIRGQIAAPVVEVVTGTVRIRKATSPGGGSGFTFTETMTAGNFALDDGGEEVFLDVPAGTYTVTEGVVPGWTLTDIDCGDNDSTGNPAARSATVNLQGGETVVCTFTNLQSLTSPTHFVFHLSGDQEVPETDSTARGGCYGQLDSTARRLALVCTHNVTGAVLAHIHRAPAGDNGPVAFEVGDPSSPIEATWDMTPAEMADLLAGNFYLNIHASGRPEGEIRGQLLPRTVDNFSFPLSASQEVPPTDSTASGNCTADLAADAASVFVQCAHNVDDISDIHLHQAPAGEDGPVVFDFPGTTSFASTVPLTPRLVADFAAGFLYVNVHSVDYETGEIRGQLTGVAAPAEVAAIPTLDEWAALLMALALAGAMWWRMR